MRTSLAPLILLVVLGTACATHTAPTPGRPDGSPVASSPTDEVRRLCEQGVEALKAGRHDEGLDLLERAWSIDRRFPDLARHLEEEYVARGLHQYSRDDFEGAVRYWELALEVAPRSRRAREYLREVRRRQDRLDEIGAEGS